jgi:hypothetical protein
MRNAEIYMFVGAALRGLRIAPNGLPLSINSKHFWFARTCHVGCQCKEECNCSGGSARTRCEMQNPVLLSCCTFLLVGLSQLTEHIVPKIMQMQS